ncbi:MAG: hypothetical protein KC503_23615 [Myxococcales bacterium]|nr:hypothetical protein [Myxococcales bacterium]
MLRHALPLALLLLLTACGGSENNGTDPEKPPAAGEIGAACASASDCNRARCLTDSSFPGGYCFEDCVTDPNACREGSVCSPYLGFSWCLDSCSADTACRDGYVCDYNVCVPPCSNDRSCRGEDTCREGRCRPPCTQDSECPASDKPRCQDGQCLPPCRVDKECLPGFRCETGSGKCVAKPGTPMGKPCQGSDKCATDYCMPTRHLCSIKCDSSTECPRGYVCGLEKTDADFNGTFDGAERDCVPVKGEHPVGGPCSKDDDCQSEHCYYGFCMEGCKVDGNCPKDYTCSNVNLLVGGAVAEYNGCLPNNGVSHNYPLGEFKAGGVVGIDVPAHAASFIFTTAIAEYDQAAIVAEAKEPAGSVIAQPTDQCNYFGQPIRYLYGTQVSSLYVPNTPTYKLTKGLHQLTMTSTAQNVTIKATVSLKLGKAQKGTLNVNWHFLNLAGSCIEGATLDAKSAPTHPWFVATVDSLKQVLAQAKISLGQQTFTDIKEPSLDVVDYGGSPNDQQKLLSMSADKSGSAINVFVVREIKGGGGLGVTLGVSGGIPGPPGLHGTGSSGVLMSAQTACAKTDAGLTLAHELGHYLGLFHNQESYANPGYDAQQKKVVCPCPCTENMICQKDFGATEWCRGIDPLPDTQFKPTNLMYWAAHGGEDFTGGTLTPNQQRVILDNPLVGH